MREKFFLATPTYLCCAVQWSTEICDYLIDELCLGSDWETVAASLNIESLEICNALPRGYCPNDCARELLRRCRKDKISFERFVAVLKKKQLNRMVHELEKRYQISAAPAATKTVPPTKVVMQENPLRQPFFRFELAKAMGNKKVDCEKMLWQLLSEEFKLGDITIHLHSGHTVIDCNQKVIALLYDGAISMEQIRAAFLKWNCAEILDSL